MCVCARAPCTAPLSGISCEIEYHEAPKPKKQIEYALEAGIPYMVRPFCVWAYVVFHVHVETCACVCTPV